MAEVKKILNVEGMSCAHCVATVKKAVSALKGINNVEVDLANNSVQVEYEAEKQNLDSIKRAIEEAGYQVRN